MVENNDISYLIYQKTKTENLENSQKEATTCHMQVRNPQ